MQIDPQPLTPTAFAPFGEVIDVPDQPGRFYHDDGLASLRPDFRPSLSLSFKPETTERPLAIEQLERHAFSSQTFVPLDAARWLIVVAPHAAAGGPDLAGVKAFVATGRQGVTYRADTWHHGLTVLDRPARFAILMWRNGGRDDEEFVPVAPFAIRIPRAFP